MKKLFLTFAIFGLLSCEVSPRKTQAEETKYNQVCGGFSCTAYQTRFLDGCEWAIFYNSDRNSTGTQPFVVNLTKERLEIELLKLQIKAYNDSP